MAWQDVPLAGGGTEKRYQCNGWDTTEKGPKSGLNAILATRDGHLVARGDGARILSVGKFRESRTATLTDADIVGHNVRYGVLFEDECNRLVPKFTYPATNYTSCDTEFFEDSAAQISAGRVLTMEAATNGAISGGKHDASVSGIGFANGRSSRAALMSGFPASTRLCAMGPAGNTQAAAQAGGKTGLKTAVPS